jgi:hypothetical protein
MPAENVQPPTKEEVESFLDELAADTAEGLHGADAVAARLAGLGIRGRRSHPRNCPVANALSHRFSSTWWVLDSHTKIPGTDMAVGIPTPVREFMERFDAEPSPYPELVFS